jgi:hypothetical protein
MKNKLLVVYIIAALLTTTSTGYAKHHHNPSNYDVVIGDFIDSYMNSDFKKLDKVLSDDACVKIPRAEAVVVQRKASLVAKMKTDKGVQQNCTSKYEIIAKSDAMVLARVDFQYTNFKQQNYIILEKNDDKEWKITQVYKMFQDTNKAAPATDNVLTFNK